MEAQLEKIRIVQKEAWNKSSAGWKKWDDLMMNFLKPMNAEMIQMLHINDADIILDVATGTGEPGLTIASLLKKGKVIGTDLAEEMLSVASQKANDLGIENFETVCCDASALPFENNTFNAITCRLGFMFFPDIQVALQEMRRVLKPGGRLVISVWDISEKNSWINASMETMISRLGLTPSPGAPGLFRCSQDGFMTNEMINAGFKNIKENKLKGLLKCGTIENYWDFITEVASPMAYGKADKILKQEIKEEVLAKVKKKCLDGNIEMDSSSIIIYGEK
jgi:ubiquinone/menaquinone biosynthesis C-methylase UbiE